jgi:hypothetical protein
MVSESVVNAGVTVLLLVGTAALVLRPTVPVAAVFIVTVAVYAIGARIWYDTRTGRPDE